MRGLISGGQGWVWLGLLCSMTIAGEASELTIYHEFNRATTNGLESQGALLRGTDGALYGTTINGGAHGRGIVFKLAPDTKAFQVLHHFSTAYGTGREPSGSLAEG